ncbi:MAG TPA: RsmG family class I SAM-dependent methyltransferase [Actinomycetota bacterium]|nr:RsmG family class I SAM-dependent methyltransferase [Actinomycetota bacterium]
MSFWSLVPDDRRALLTSYESLLLTEGVPRGVVSRGDAGRIRQRHVEDSLRGVVAVPSAARSLCDIGSGGGLPGVVLAIALPEVRVTLAERRNNRASFLATVVAELGLSNAEVFSGDVGSLTAATFDVCSARAFAGAAATWVVAERLLVAGGRLLYWAGESFDPRTANVAGAHVTVSAASEVAGSGPLVIMTRQ